MIPAATVPAVICIVVAISIVLMLIRPRNIPEVCWISAGVIVLLTLRLITLRLTERALLKAVDVCLFLIGMMLISELAREHGVFEWLSSIAIRGAHGSRARLFVLVYIIGTIVTILMSNDATAVVLTPAILTAVRKAKVQPLPYLFVCAFIANAASFVLPISNPANLVVFHGAMPRLAEWMLAFGIPSVLSIVTTFFVLRWIFHKELQERIENGIEEYALNNNGKLVVASVLVVVVVLLLASCFGKNLGLPTFLAALVITVVVGIKEKSNLLALAREISWEALALVGGLFVMVDAMESIGAMEYAKHWLAHAESLGIAAGELVTGFLVGAGTNLVNNLPLGLIAGGAVQATHVRTSLADAVLIGVDLGPNLSITGSLASILWLIALRREKLDVSFWDFFRIGVIATPLALLAALAGSIMMQFWFHAS